MHSVVAAVRVRFGETSSRGMVVLLHVLMYEIDQPAEALCAGKLVCTEWYGFGRNW